MESNRFARAVATTAVVLATGLSLLASPAPAQIEPGSLDVRWNTGAPDCKARPQPPIQVHRYNPTTFIMRENLCATFEAPFIYLLVGQTRALLIDTGDVTDPAVAPLAATVSALLPQSGPARMALLVVHTHRHSDHRAGDAQFARLRGVQVVGYDLGAVRSYYHFTDWPRGVAQIDLGGRTVDVFPTPGHNETHVAFYDRGTALLFSGDFLLPGRLFIDDAAADLASARRAAAFVTDRPVSAVLGGHIEENAKGEMFDWGSQYHPDEHALPLTKADVFALPAAIGRFNGLYTQSGPFEMLDTMRLLYVFLAIVIATLTVIGFGALRFFHRRKRRGRL